jgi:hypothetical protein
MLRKLKSQTPCFSGFGGWPGIAAPSGNGVTFSNEVIVVKKGFDDGGYHAE